ncbi:hypothetical protein ONE63_007103 [Megalurothrips usitatus]|uniref:alpha-glucosidase n=1 Tax=Megalurothrips usitatus TaxID=439358 RepID=A0AAV7XQY2_9NEOP|nr:hypothetical protein ONE63_007103 [Megalurothrips usitatus]
MRRAHATLAVALSLAALAVMTTMASPPKRMLLAGSKATAEEELWWHHAVIYQIYPRSFKDSNGDGVGDLQGIISKLDYLKDIGVGAVWLSPIYPSPQKDFGYDISNFKDVDPVYGTLADFDELIKKTHDLGMKVVVDLVPNHSSDEHEWFVNSAKGDSKYKDYYIWRDGKKNADGTPELDENGKPKPPNNWFSAWEYNENRKQFYLHQFAVGQPDLNYGNEAVVQEIKDVFTFWMERGVDGFRVDALPFLFETDYDKDEPENPHKDSDLTTDDYDYFTHPYTMDMDGTYDMLQQWREVVDKFHDGKPRVIMTECYTNFENTIRYYGTKERPGAHFTFNFQILSYLSKASNATDFKNIIDQWMEQMNDWRWPNWVIGNHDNSRVATRFPNMADAMNMISLTLPGTAMTYNGEELGMTDTYITWEQTKDPSGLNAGKEKYLTASRDPVRTPHQWNDSPNAGFSTNATTWMPTNPNYWQVNVVKEQANPKSHLNVYKDLVATRSTETMKQGELKTAVLEDDILVITRSLNDHETYITLVNFGSWVKTIKTKDLSSQSLKVYAAGDSSTLSKGADALSEVTLRPKEGLVLTTGAVVGSTTQPPTTPVSTKAPTTASTRHDTTTPSGSTATTAALFVSLLVPLIGLMH